MDWFRHNSSEAYQQQRHEQRATWTGPTTVSLKHQRYNSPPENQGGKAKDTDAWATWKQQQHSNKGWNWKSNQWKYNRKPLAKPRSDGPKDRWIKRACTAKLRAAI